jgi:peptidoglycan hydrolase CwlO-like protein
MSDVTPDKLEISEHRTKNWMLIAVVGFLFVLVNGFFSYGVMNASTEMRETNRNLIEVNATLRVMQTQYSYLQKQVDDLQNSKKEAAQVHQVHDTRLNSVEQRIALHDQWIQAQTH